VPGGQIIAGVAASKLGAIAGAVSAVSGTLAQVTAKSPTARGQVAEITIGANQPIPYMMGRSYSGGALIHDVGYGGNENPYRAITVVYSGAGPISGLVAVNADFTPIGLVGKAATGYYSGFLWVDYLDGTGPAPRALAAQFAGEPGWSSAHKLSGFFCAKFTLKFDKKGKIYQSGVPQFGMIADGVWAYDPRLDSTRPGGSGSQRIDNEATWAFTKNPALHTLTYAYGRYQNGKKIFGVDLGDVAIDIATATAWANVCDANAWEVNGTIFEPDDKWNNLKLIAEAGGGVPVPGSRLRFSYDAPGVSVDNITIHDLADGEISLPVAQGFANRLNTVQGVYTSPDHRWEPKPTDKIVDTALLASDGEEKAKQIPFKLVTNKNQAAQLAAYKMANSREIGPIVIPVKARLLTYPVGTFLTALLPDAGLASQKVKIIGKRRTMADGSGEITVVTETDAKHVFALAAVSGAPPVPTLVPPEKLDELAINLAMPPSTQWPALPPTDVMPGHIYIGESGHKFRFDGRALLFNGEPLTFYGDPIYTSGYVDAQDQATVQALADAAAAQAAANAANAAIALIDDDDVITISEKVETLIPGAAAFEALYTAVVANANAASVSITTLNTRRTAWLSALAAISPAWNDVSAASPVVRGSLDTARSQYDSELKEVQRLAIEAMTAARQVVIVPPLPQTVYRTWQGVIKTSQYPRTLTPQVEQGGVDIRTRNDVSYAITTTGSIAATVNNTNGSADKGRITATDGSNGSIVLTVSIGGLSQPPFTIPFTNVDDNPPTTGGGGNTGGSDSTLEDVTSTSFAPITQQDAGESVFLIDITAGQFIQGIAPLSYITDTSGAPNSMVAGWEYRLQGSVPWVSFVSGPTYVEGTPAIWDNIGYYHVEGSINANQSISGLATGTYECRLVAAKLSGTGDLQIISGMATVTRSAEPIM
jgi:hypothetical protein